MRLRVIRQRCEATLRDVTLPSPFTVSAFCDVVSERRGRRICLTPKENRLGPCGLWLAMDDADYVFYEADTSPVHREHIILHELAHLLCDHVANELFDGELLRQLVPNVDITRLRQVMGRTTYSMPEEQEAEVMASLIHERAERARPAARPWSPDERDTVLQRLEAVLDTSRQRDHG